MSYSELDNVEIVKEKVVLAINNEVHFRPDLESIKLKSNHYLLAGVQPQAVFDSLMFFENDQNMFKVDDIVDVGAITVYQLSHIDKACLERWINDIDSNNGTQTNIKKYSDLSIDLNRCELTLGVETVPVSITRDEIKLLLLLMDKPETVVEYLTIAQTLDVNSVLPNEKTDQLVLTNALKVKKQGVFKYLVRCGLSNDSADKIRHMIRSKTNVGYLITQS